MVVAADTSRWFAVDGGYGAADWRGTFGDMIRSGVIFDEGNEGAVYADSTGMQVKVPSFGGWVAGKHGIFNGETVLPVGARIAGANRIDRVVMRITEATKAFELDVKQGTTGTPPTLTQSAGVWEESLAQILVDSDVTIASGKITDERFFWAAPGGVINCLSTNRPAHKRGRKIIERDTSLRERVSDGTNWLWIPGTGSVVGCNLKKGSSQTLANATWTALTLDVVNWDHAALHASTNPGFIASASAIWGVEAFVEYAASGENSGQTWASGSGLDRQVAFNLDGSAFYTSGSVSHIMRTQPAARDSTFRTRIGTYKEFDLSAGDHISLLGRQDSGGSVDVTAASLNARIVGYNI